MNRIVLGVGASHSTLMNTHWAQTVHLDRAERFRNALAAARDSLAGAAPDTVVIIGSNHFRGFWLDLIPSFTIGVGECIASGESGTPKGPQPVDVPLARHIADTLITEFEIDIAFSARLQIDHGQSHAIQYLLAGLGVQIVPIVINVFAPPLPTLSRCEQLGGAVRAAVAGFPEDRRVAVIGSGGLSHRLPWPDWRDPHGDDEEFVAEAWLRGRENWQKYDPHRREIISRARSSINGKFDREFLSWIESGQARRLTELTTEQLEATAGNGAQELRTWVAMAAAMDHAPGRCLAYEQLPEWLTGMAVALLDPDNIQVVSDGKEDTDEYLEPVVGH